MRHYRLFLLSCILLLLSACNLSSEPPTAEPLDVSTISPGGKPNVAISSPAEGDEVVVNAQIFVTASATDSVGVTRIQLVAGTQVVKTVSSESPSGQTNFPVLLDYTPRQTGEVTLQVIAYRGAIASDPAEVTINVRANEAQVTATIAPSSGGNSGVSVPVIDPNDPTCRALTNTGLNLRTGPGTNYDRITVLSAGVQVPIVGRLGDNSWWQVRSGLSVGWIAASFTSVYGTCTSVPVVAAPPSPTPPGFVPTPIPTLAPPATAVPKATATPGKPDLVITSIGGPLSVTLPADPVTYSVVISNLGSAASGAFANRVTLPDGSTSDLGVVANLGPGESITLNVTFDFNGVGTGSFSLQATADSDSQVTELSEVNNNGQINIAVS